MKKTVISLLLAAVIMACGVIGASAAAPAEFASDCSGKSSDVIYVKRPEKLYDTTTVSYTHLDVYKRQSVTCTAPLLISITMFFPPILNL